MNNNNRNMLIPALFLLAIGVAALLEASAFSVLLILFGLLMLVRYFDNNRADQGNRGYMGGYYDDEDEDEIYPPQRQAHAEPVYKHALQAVKRAGLDPDHVQVLPVDVGLMVFKGHEDPVVYRTWPVPDDVDYVQPYVQLRLPTKAQGRVKFEIFDSGGQALFVHEDIHNLTRGRNLISPSARLAIHDERNLEGRWTLRITADGVLLAEHNFTWVEATSENIRKHIGEDGELTSELRAVMAENRLEKMSLDDLLAFQDNEAAQQTSGKA